MKMNKKKVFTLALAVCLIAILSMGSLAWFSDSDSITNDFMFAGSDDVDPDEIFSVDVWEIGEDGAKDDDGITYTELLPGDELVKEVYVENTGVFDQYIRVHVTINNAGTWINELGEGYDLGTIFGGHDEDVWTRFEEGVYDANSDTYTMTFYLNEILTPDATVCLFETFTVPAELTLEGMLAMDAGFQLTVVAEAVQTTNLGIDTTDNVCDALQAFQVVLP